MFQNEPSNSSDDSSREPKYGSYGNLRPRRLTNSRIEALRERRRNNPTLQYAGIFRLRHYRDADGQRRVEVLEHHIPRLGFFDGNGQFLGRERPSIEEAENVAVSNAAPAA